MTRQRTPDTADESGFRFARLLNLSTFRGASLTIALVILSVIAVVAGIEKFAQIFPEYKLWTSLTQHMVVTFLVVYAFHAIERFQSEKSTTRILDNIQAELESQIRKVVPFGVTAKQLGLVGLYASRKDAMEAVRERIQRADTKIRLLGVAFKEQLELTRNDAGISAELRKFAGHYPDGDNLQILLLHPMTSPAVFRAFLETPARTIKKILQYHDKDSSEGAATYFDTQLFSDCNLTHLTLHNSDLSRFVKYYRRDPNLWMILVDDEVFIESYTFGRSDVQQEAATGTMRLGGHMPVFRFRGFDTIPYKILDDHFTRLWMTSTDTIEDLAGQINASSRKDYVNEKVFDVRKEWFDQVYAALSDLESKNKI